MKGLLTAYMLNPKLQNAQDVANINAKGRVDAAGVGAKARLEGPAIDSAALDQAADVYTKTGRSGTMMFTVQRSVFTNQGGNDVTTIDWRLIYAMDDSEG